MDVSREQVRKLTCLCAYTCAVHVQASNVIVNVKIKAINKRVFKITYSLCQLCLVYHDSRGARSNTCRAGENCLNLVDNIYKTNGNLHSLKAVTIGT